MKTPNKAPNKVSGFQNNKWKSGKQKHNKNKKTNRQNKLHIKFDVEDRRAYLTGFQKRKRERREKAFKQLKDDLKTEMKQIKKERKDIVKKMIQQSQELIDNGGIGMIDDEDKEEEEESDKNKVTVNCGSAMVEICDLDLTSKHHIGQNQMDANTSDTKNNDKQDATDEHSVEEKNDEEEDEEDEEDVSPENLDRLGIHSERDLHRSLKKSSAMAIKRSNLMKKKQLRDATKQKKAQSRENNRRRKLKAKKMRHKRPTKNKDA